jgi:hypothetical protein
MLLRHFRPYGLVFMNVFVKTIAMIMLLRDFGPYGLVFMICCYNRCYDNALSFCFGSLFYDSFSVTTLYGEEWECC